MTHPSGVSSIMGIYEKRWQYSKKSVTTSEVTAAEDIVVELAVNSTQFNVLQGFLFFPLWEKASNDVYDILVGHEVGHALFTLMRMVVSIFLILC